MKKERIGIYGGSFSPPHKGHIRAAETFLREAELDRLYIMPANIPPHKQIKGSVPAEVRYWLCRLAFDGIRDIEVSDYEIKKQGISYTVDTLRHFASEERELFLLCGDDMFLTLDTWREPREIFRLSHIVSMRRYEDGADKLCCKGEEYKKKFGAAVHYIKAEPYPVSSTEIRELLEKGESAGEYLTEAVEKQIYACGLYGTKDMKKFTEKYTEEDIVALRERVRPYLTEKRYGHVLAVEREAEFLGRIYLPEKVNALRASALLHDITKKCDFEKQLKYCSEFGIIISDYDIMSPKTFHAMTAAALIKRDFSDFADGDTVSGVRWHTTGHDEMTDFEAIVYLADYIEDTRTFPDCVLLRQYFRQGLEDGEDKAALLYRTMVKSFDMTVRMLIDEGSPVSCDTVSARNYYLKRLAECDASAVK